MKVIIMSGVPGSGKSTFTKSLKGDVVICSADNYFLDENGVYNFNPSKLGEAHGSCLHRFTRNLITMRDRTWAKDTTLVVDNTNTSALEMAPYVALAAAFEVECELVTVLCDPHKAHARNTHGVPLQGVLRMDAAIRSRELPPFWNIKKTVVEQ